MKTTTCSLLLIIFLFQLMVPGNTGQNLESLLEKKIREYFALQASRHSPVTKSFSCTSVKAMGRLASCPAGMVATGCSCGFACGSWNVQNENICHCLCPLIDWTVARCCQLP
uniref:resistin-like alpha n=1 Tax=Myodes glareolus TaxID=447135 RepID=UPI002021D151|nr:resistin-like alpha [Myodes glareolus]XP_048310373.1 resistin-like alpha [Myodes glareolus]